MRETKVVVDEILVAYGESRDQLINIMQAIQRAYRHLPKDALEYVSRRLDISEAKIYGVATFYENFSLEEKGRYVIKICDGTACHVRRSIPIYDAICQELGLSSSKKTSDDRMFTLETVSCLGACGLAPVITVNDHVYPKMEPKKAVELIHQIREEEKDAD